MITPPRQLFLGEWRTFRARGVLAGLRGDTCTASTPFGEAALMSTSQSSPRQEMLEARPFSGLRMLSV